MHKKLDIPDNYIDYRIHFNWSDWRSFDMLTAYVETWLTYREIWENSWNITRERVRQCINWIVEKINKLKSMPVNTNMVRTKQTTIDFINMLSKFREWMEAERLTMTEVEFAKKYNVCYTTVCKHMWFPWPKNLKRKWEVILDPIEVNKMRITMSDTDLIAHFKTSQWNLNRQCWTREQNWIPKVSVKRKNRVVTIKMDNIDINERGLKMDRWEYSEPSDYEKQWMEEAVDLDKPHPTLFSKIK